MRITPTFTRGKLRPVYTECVLATAAMRNKLNPSVYQDSITIACHIQDTTGKANRRVVMRLTSTEARLLAQRLRDLADFAEGEPHDAEAQRNVNG